MFYSDTSRPPYRSAGRRLATSLAPDMRNLTQRRGTRNEAMRVRICLTSALHSATAHLVPRRRADLVHIELLPALGICRGFTRDAACLGRVAMTLQRME